VISVSDAQHPDRHVDKHTPLPVPLLADTPSSTTPHCAKPRAETQWHREARCFVQPNGRHHTSCLARTTTPAQAEPPAPCARRPRRREDASPTGPRPRAPQPQQCLPHREQPGPCPPAELRSAAPLRRAAARGR